MAASFMLISPVCATGTFDTQADEFGIDSLYSQAPDEVKSSLDGDLDVENLQDLISYEKLVDFITDNLVSALKDNLSMLTSIVGLLIIMGIYEVLRNSFNDKGDAKLLDFACASTAAAIVCPPLYERISELTSAAQSLSEYMTISLPVMTSLMTASGNVTTAAILHLVLYNATVFAGGLFTTVLVPLAGTYMCIGLAAAISDNDGLKSLALGLRTLVNKGVLVLSAGFTLLLSLQTIISGAGDTLTKRALKLAVGSFLPVTGSVMAESVDTFLGSIGVLKSIAGVFSIVVIFYLIVIPVIKMAVNYLSLKAACLIGDLLGTGRVRSMLSIIADAYSLLIAISCGLMVMFLVCLAIILITGT